MWLLERLNFLKAKSGFRIFTETAFFDLHEINFD